MAVDNEVEAYELRVQQQEKGPRNEKFEELRRGIVTHLILKVI